MIWKQLLELKCGAIPRGAIIRTTAKYPYENFVDFMVFDPVLLDNVSGLIVVSGYKAGLILRILPPESNIQHGIGLSTEWVKKNWQKEVYGSPVKQVLVCLRGRDPPRPK